MSIVLPIAVFGNGELYRELFNAIAAAFSDTIYGYLIKLSLCLTGAWAIFNYTCQRNIMVFGKWLCAYYVAFYIVLLPQATMEIFDEMNPGKAYSVDHVPLGLAMLASLTSSVGAGLTELMEKNFSLPDDLKYSHTGLVMASRLMLASAQFEVTDPNFQKSLQSFTQQCVFYDLLLNKYSWQDLLNTTNIWQFLSGYAAKARAFAYTDVAGASQILTCQEGFSKLNEDWKNALTEASARYGARLFPEAQDGKNQLLSYLPNSYQFLTQISDSAANLMQQNMLSNSLQNGIVQMSTTLNAPAALEAYTYVKAQQQKRLTNMTVGDMAAYWLPIMKNVLEAALYGSFIFIFLLLLFPFGGSVFKYYAASLLWFQLWAPIYAILNLFMNFYAQRHNIAALQLGQGLSGLTLAAQSGLAQVNADVASLAGYLSLSVPLIATGIVKGMMSVFSTAAQYIAGVTQGAASGAASEAVSGNLSLGNTNFSNHSSFNTSANHFDTNARTFSGMYSTQMAEGSSLSIAPSGDTILNNQSAISSLGTSINLSHAIREQANLQADKADTASFNYANAYVDSTASSLRYLNEIADHVGSNAMSGDSSSISVTGGRADALHDVQQLTERFAHDHQISTASASRYLGAAYMEAKAGGSLGIVSGALDEKFETDKSHSQETRALYSAAQDYLHNSNYAASVDSAVRGVEESSYRASNEEGQRLLNHVSNALDDAQQSRHEMLNSQQTAQSYREMASFADENAVSINSNANQTYHHWLKEQGLSEGAIEQMMVNQPQEAEAYAQKFMQAESARYLNNFQKAHPTSADEVALDFSQHQQNFPNENAVAQAYQNQHDQLQQQAAQQGLKSGLVTKKSIADANALVRVTRWEANSAALAEKITDIKEEVNKHTDH